MVETNIETNVTKDLTNEEIINKEEVTTENLNNTDVNDNIDVSDNVDASDNNITQEKSFNDFGLDEPILRAIEDAGFDKVTPIQEQAIPVLIHGNDIIGQSRTGTGKTAAFCLPIIQGVDPTLKNVQALVVCPTRELAMQTATEFRRFTKYMENVNCLAVYGGELLVRQIKPLRRGATIVVGTPGRLIDHINRKTLKLDKIKTVVLDEADEMLNMGFEEDVKTILDKAPEDHQTVLFSATMSDRIKAIAQKYLKEPVEIKIKSDELTVNKIEQTSICVKQTEKSDAIVHILDEQKAKKTVVFCNTRKKVDALVLFLSNLKYKCRALHGEISQKQRQVIMRGFRDGEFDILVATDVAARGIDVEDLELVINFDIPQENEYYVHRIGRTGRNGKTGMAVTLFGRREYSKLREIEKFAKTKITEVELTPLAFEMEITMSDKTKTIERIQKLITMSKKSDFGDSGEVLTELLKENDIQDIVQALIKSELTHTAKFSGMEKRGDSNSKPQRSRNNSGGGRYKEKSNASNSDRNSGKNNYRSSEKSGDEKSKKDNFKSKDNFKPKSERSKDEKPSGSMPRGGYAGYASNKGGGKQKPMMKKGVRHGQRGAQNKKAK